MRYIDLNDAEAVLRAIHMTDRSVPLDIVLHTPGGLVLATQIARAINTHPATSRRPNSAARRAASWSSPLAWSLSRSSASPRLPRAGPRGIDRPPELVSPPRGERPKKSSKNSSLPWPPNRDSRGEVALLSRKTAIIDLTQVVGLALPVGHDCGAVLAALLVPVGSLGVARYRGCRRPEKPGSTVPIQAIATDTQVEPPARLDPMHVLGAPAKARPPKPARTGSRSASSVIPGTRAAAIWSGRTSGATTWHSRYQGRCGAGGLACLFACAIGHRYLSSDLGFATNARWPRSPGGRPQVELIGGLTSAMCLS
jgi:hypothetical protein